MTRDLQSGKPGDKPSERDWGDWEADFDQTSAHETFAGLSHDEAVAKFGSLSVIDAISDLSFSAPVPFRYYFTAFAVFVAGQKGLRSAESAIAAHVLLQTAESKLANASCYITPIIGQLMPVIRLVASSQDDFGADAGVYGDFKERVRRIDDLMAAKESAPPTE